METLRGVGGEPPARPFASISGSLLEASVETSARTTLRTYLERLSGRGDVSARRRLEDELYPQKMGYSHPFIAIPPLFCEQSVTALRDRLGAAMVEQRSPAAKATISPRKVKFLNRNFIDKKLCVFFAKSQSYLF